MLKRAFDFAVAIAAIALLSPVLVFVAGLVWLNLGSPVLFKQVRPGLHGREFVLVKFRSMRDATASEEGEPHDHDRLGRFGRFIRSTSLDELPELWNVVCGEMSLVGPRPLLLEYLPLYSPYQARRHEVRPGITGWAQINGRNAIGWDEKFDLDIWYVDNQSFALDLRILFLTAWKVFRRQGISHGQEATMPKFSGSGSGGAAR